MSKLNITVEFEKDRQMNSFVSMLAWMKLCGNVGHSSEFKVFIDGDGSARPKFTFSDENIQNDFEKLRKSLLDDIESGIEPYINIE